MNFFPRTDDLAYARATTPDYYRDHPAIYFQQIFLMNFFPRTDDLAYARATTPDYYRDKPAIYFYVPLQRLLRVQR